MPASSTVTPEQMEFPRLRAENKRLQMELKVAKKGGVLREGAAVKYAWIDLQCRHYPLSALCGVLAGRIGKARKKQSGWLPWKGVEESSHRAWRARPGLLRGRCRYQEWPVCQSRQHKGI